MATQNWLGQIESTDNNTGKPDHNHPEKNQVTISKNTKNPIFQHKQKVKKLLCFT